MIYGIGVDLVSSGQPFRGHPPLRLVLPEPRPSLPRKSPIARASVGATPALPCALPPRRPSPRPWGGPGRGASSGGRWRWSPTSGANRSLGQRPGRPALPGGRGYRDAPLPQRRGRPGPGSGDFGEVRGEVDPLFGKVQSSKFKVQSSKFKVQSQEQAQVLTFHPFGKSRRLMRDFSEKSSCRVRTAHHNYA